MNKILAAIISIVFFIISLIGIKYTFDKVIDNNKIDESSFIPLKHQYDMNVKDSVINSLNDSIITLNQTIKTLKEK